ncbi:MAG: discoidin domain-containing protein [Bdellovibrionales bacterium]|nr:discoidin domain-containing protein [Bdellovibrionales bacterium]
MKLRGHHNIVLAALTLGVALSACFKPDFKVAQKPSTVETDLAPTPSASPSATPSVTASPSPSPSPSPSVTPSASAIPSPSPSPSVTPSASASPSPSPSPSATATPSPSPSPSASPSVAPSGVADVALGKSVTALAENAGNPASNLTDGNSTTFWTPPSGARAYHFAQVDLAGTFSINKIDLEVGTTTNSAPADFEVQYEDRGCYQTIASTVVTANPASGLNHSFTLPSNVVTKKLRVVCKGTGYCRIRTLKAWGVSVNPDTQPGSTCNAGQQVVARSGNYDYAQFLPNNYNADPDVKFPLVIALHGIGGMITEADRSAVRASPEGLPKQLKVTTFKNNFPAIAISAHCREVGVTSGDCWFSRTRLEALLEEAKMTYRVDEDRIYMTGLSGGGMRTMEFAYYHHDILAAVVPIAGGWDGIPSAGRGFDAGGAPVVDTQGRHLCDLVSLPIYGTHGTNDGTVAASGTISIRNILVTQCAAAPRKVQIKLFPGAGHSGSTWDATYADTKVWDFVFAQRLSTKGQPLANQEPIVDAGANRTVTLGAPGTLTPTASDPDGTIASAAWINTNANPAWPLVQNGLNLDLSLLPQGTNRLRLIVTDNLGVSRYDDVIVTVNP